MKKTKKPFEELWELTERDPELGIIEMQELNDYIKGVVIEWPLSEVISNQQLVLDALKPYVE
jgi:hypothetical protein